MGDLVRFLAGFAADLLRGRAALVAENTRVREFDRRGNEVWKKEMTWAVEVNRY